MTPKTEEKIYKILRDYQDGKLNEGRLITGRLDIPLSNVFNQTIKAIRED